VRCGKKEPKDSHGTLNCTHFASLSHHFASKNELQTERKNEKKKEKLTFLLRGMKKSPHPNGAVYLIGTVHVSSVSGEEVARLIQQTRPQIVMVELCQGRSAILTMKDRPSRNQTLQQQQQQATGAVNTEVVATQKQQKQPGLIYSVFTALRKGEGLRGVFTKKLGEKMSEVQI